MKKQKGAVNTTLRIVLLVLLVIYSVSLLFPLGWGFLTSLKSSIDFDTLGNVFGFPNTEWSKDQLFKLSNYTSLFGGIDLPRSVSFFMGNTEISHATENSFGGMIVNSLIYALGGALVNTTVSMCVAYVCSKYKFKMAAVIYALVLFSMSFSPAGIYASTISLLRSIGIYDTWFGYFFMKFNIGGMYFLFFYSFYQGLSDTYIEAAEIDGASQFRIMFSIIIPLSATIFSTIALLIFVQLWNDYQTPLLYMPTKPTVAFAIYYFTTKTTGGIFAEGGEPQKIALCMILAVPIIVIFVIFKDKIMGNVTMGGIKG